MTKKSYTKRDTTCERVFGGRYLIEAKKIGILVSTRQDGNMDPRFSENAKDNYDRFFEKHNLKAGDSFCPALGQNYRIIAIEEFNAEKFAGRFIENGEPQDEYHCDSVIVCDASIPVAFRIGDCPTVLIVGNNLRGKTIMAHIHAGRAELLAEILKNTVAKMNSDYQLHILSATAYVFPHICKHCYKLADLDPATKEKARNFLDKVNDYYHLDLLSWLTRQLEEAGIRRVVTAFCRCTAGISPVCVSRLLHDREKLKSLFFSHYRSYHNNLPEGRFVVVVRMIEKDDEDDKEEEFYEI